MRRPLYPAVALALLLLGCATSGPEHWTKEGADAAGATDAYNECKETADPAVHTEADINKDIVASRGGDWGRGSIGRVATQSMQEGTGTRIGRIIAACMRAKGFSAAP